MSELIVGFILIALGIHRVSELITYDTILDPIRKWIGRHAVKPNLWRILADWIHCPYCNSVWLAFGGTFFLVPATIRDFVIYWLALSGLAAILQTVAGRSSSE